MLGRTEHRRTDLRQQQITDCQGSSCYSLRKQQQQPVVAKYDMEDAIYYLQKGKDKRGLAVKFINEEIGKGVFAVKDFETGSFLLEYDGELIKAAEGRHREKTYPLCYGSYIYFFQYESRRFCLDGTFSKRKGKYVNDGIGKEQNAIMKMIEWDKKPHLALFATRPILKGEEIRYDYGVTDLPWRYKTKARAVKDCRIELERLSLKQIEAYCGTKEKNVKTDDGHDHEEETDCVETGNVEMDMNINVEMKNKEIDSDNIEKEKSDNEAVDIVGKGNIETDSVKTYNKTAENGNSLQESIVLPSTSFLNMETKSVKTNKNTTENENSLQESTELPSTSFPNMETESVKTNNKTAENENSLQESTELPSTSFPNMETESVKTNNKTAENENSLQESTELPSTSFPNMETESVKTNNKTAENENSLQESTELPSTSFPNMETESVKTNNKTAENENSLQESTELPSTSFPNMETESVKTNNKTAENENSLQESTELPSTSFPNMETESVKTNNKTAENGNSLQESIELPSTSFPNMEMDSIKTSNQTAENENSLQESTELPSTSGIKIIDSVSDSDLYEFLCVLVDEHIVSQAISRGVLIDEDEVETVPEKLVGSEDLLTNAVLKKNARQFFTDDAWLTVESTIKMIETTASFKVSKHSTAKVVVKQRKAYCGTKEKNVKTDDGHDDEENTQLTDEIDEVYELYDKVPYNPSFKIPLPDNVEVNPSNPNLLRFKYNLSKIKPITDVKYIPKRKINYKKKTLELESNKEQTDCVETGNVEMDMNINVEMKNKEIDSDNIEKEKSDNEAVDIVGKGNIETDSVKTYNKTAENGNSLQESIVLPSTSFLNMETESVKTSNQTAENENSLQENTELPSTSGIKITDTVSDIDLYEFLCVLVDEHIVSQAISRGVLIDEDEVETVPEKLVGSEDLLTNAVLKKNARQYFTDDAWLTVESTIKMIETTASVKVSKQSTAKVVVKQRKDCRPKRPCPYCGKFFRRLTKHLKTKVHREELQVKQAITARKQEKDNYFNDLKKLGYNKVNVQRMKESEKPDLISEKKCKNKKLAICSFCRGTFTLPYISRHKRKCHANEGTTMTPVSIPVSLIAETVMDPLFVEEILAKFKDDEPGNLCRTDEFIKSFGSHRFRKYKTRVDKKQEIRTSIMCEMRRLAKLYLAFKEEAVRHNVFPNSVPEILKVKNFNILINAVDSLSTSEDGTQKYGLKRNLGYLLKLVGKFRKGSMLIQENDAASKSADVFLFCLEYEWITIFDAAEYNCKMARQKELRRPKRLPNENDVRQLRNVTLSEIKRLTADEYKIMTKSDFVRLRNLVVSRLTLFNARRGGEPGRLELKEWYEAKEGVWLDKSHCKALTVPWEKHIVGRFYLAYQSGKRSGQVVPLLIPEDCWTAIRILVDPGVRASVSVNDNNRYTFPCVYSSLRHVLGWHCTDSACRLADLHTVVTATVMRHRASTYYATLDLPSADKEAFYRHMGHTEEINKNVYQCPMGIKEIISVGKFLEGIEQILPEKSEEENLEMDYQQIITVDEQTDNTAQIEEFLKQLVDENVFDRALSGAGLIEEEEVEIIPEKLYPYHELILSFSIQKKARCYFTKDAWTTAQNTFLMLEELKQIKVMEKRQKGKCQESDSDSDWSYLEDETNSSEDEKKVKKCRSKRKRVTEKTAKPTESDQNKQTEMRTLKKKVERSYYQWNECDSKKVADYFKKEIHDTESRKYPGTAAINFFLKTNPSILEGIPESQKAQKIKTKIFNERSKIRSRLKKTMDKLEKDEIQKQ